MLEYLEGQTHVVTGAGPVGSTVALRLAGAGAHVRLLNRSGSGPEHPLVERARVDAGDRAALAPYAEGAVALHNCIHGSVYAADVWRRELPVAEQAVMDVAADAGAVVVFPESLYSYGVVPGVITEDRPREADFGKPGVRTELLRARDAHRVPTVSIVAADFFGPLVRTSHAGERLVPAVLAGKKVRAVGALDQPHSFTYVPDLAAAMVRASQDKALWDDVLHAPTNRPVTQQRLVEDLARAAGVPVPRTGVIPMWLVRMLGLAIGQMREVAELDFQFDRPFEMDSSASERRLGLAPTPWEQAVAETVAWWRAQS